MSQVSLRREGSTDPGIRNRSRESAKIQALLRKIWKN
jgi:hypothetical protein